MTIRPEIQPHFPTFFDRLVTLAIDQHQSLAVDVDLILDSFADEQRRLGRAADHS